MSNVNKAIRLAAIVMALSMLGLVLHNVREFGWAALLSPSTGTIPMIVFGLLLVIVWWQIAGLRTVVTIFMIGYGVLNLVGGGVLSVLPMGFLPFEPEQSLPHYTSHVIYSVTQLPLIWFGFHYLFAGNADKAKETTK